VNLARHLINKIPANWSDITLGALALGAVELLHSQLLFSIGLIVIGVMLLVLSANDSEERIDGYSWRNLRGLNGVIDLGLAVAQVRSFIDDSRSYCILSDLSIDFGSIYCSISGSHNILLQLLFSAKKNRITKF
jgi:hypothetical protein